MTPRGQQARTGRAAARLALVVTLGGAVLGVGAAPVAAKGITSARVTDGPGIDAPIAVRDAATVHELARLSGLYDVAYGGGTPTPIDRPHGDLGPRYVVEFRVPRAGGPVPVRQHLHPYAGGGPVVHTPGGQRLERVDPGDPRGRRPCSVCAEIADSWSSAPPEVLGVLPDLGLPEPRTALAAAGAPKAGSEGWPTVSGTDPRVRLRIPAAWNASTDHVMLPVQVDPVMPLAVGTAAVEPQAVGECGVVPQRALGAVGPTDAFVGVYVTDGLASWSATIPRRPKTFAAALPWRLGAMKCMTADVTALVRTIAFEEHGVKLTLLVATGARIPDGRRAELVAVLDSLDVAGGPSRSPGDHAGRP